MKNRQAEIIKHMNARELLYHLYLSQIVFFVIGLILAFLLFNSIQSITQIFAWQPIDIFVIGTVIALVVVVVDLVLMKLVPKRLLDDGGINEKMFQTRSLPHIIFLAFIIAFAEEFLFRGVIQTHFGIWVASILFAVLHIRYLHKWVLFILVVTISFILGYTYEVTGSLWVTIWAHFLIDLLLAYKIRADYIKNNKTGVERDGDQ
ncbi:CPBP family intramembrane glutamic endopeptidase [Bacillus sp. CHD6a]|uniref:CPBP family intramembrane glutamic endopeptidase n=1 Tax=Bacillus sp. CHD6a TaxID=1643452 RepID=UPI0006CD7D2A|nr:CPBP family intramembrane glutamic endopeptidase [Bacillus sp. CHD6a]KPB03107.1 CAAX protease [Bacillus sp. CHD6a]